MECFAIVLQEINSQINNSSGYLGAISDRSKELYFKKVTVGEYLYKQLEKNPHTKLKNQVFYRQDYLDEFETIWEKQKEFYPELTDELKTEIRDVIIFYQRPLKSQKGLLSHCEFESWEQEYTDKETRKKKKRRVGHRVVPRSSPLFQEFKIWHNLNNIILTDKTTGEIAPLEQETKEIAFSKLNIVNKLTDKDFLILIVENPKDFQINFKEIEGNRTNAELYKAFQKILEFEGDEYNFPKMNVEEINNVIIEKFIELGISTEILKFDSEIDGNYFDKQPIIQLWHLLYSFVEDKSKTGDENLIKKLEKKFGFKKEYAKLIANLPLQPDYSGLSSRAIRKILPFLKEGNTYDVACTYAGYNHSSSLTKEERENRELIDKLELLPKNSLRNPIVEKILNQMVNVVNALVDEQSKKDDKGKVIELFKFDEIRIELARDLKKSAKEREEKTKAIREVTASHEKIREILQSKFRISKVTRNDIIRYKLWQELANNGYKTLYTNTRIREEELFSKEFDIEHIIPQAKLFDDSFSNKTLTVRDINIEKGNETAFDFLKVKLSEEEFNQYLGRIERMQNNKSISKTKLNKLKMKSKDIPDDFIERDLRNSQYIAKKAVQMLSEVFKTVNTTTGSVTNRLRNDWQLVNVMKELNLPKYEKLGLVETIEGKNGQPEKRIKDWTKRNDHRHHAMDALTVAFTTYSHVQYLNNMNARGNESHKKYHKVYGIEKKYLHRAKNNKLLFNAPMPIHEFRSEVKKHLENILISFKAKNKVVTRNKNKTKIKGKDNYKIKIELTPRGQLHKETVYGRIKQYRTKVEKVGTNFNLEKINLVANKKYREALLARLNEFNGNPKKAFSGKNAPSKTPIYIDDAQTIAIPEKVKLVCMENVFTIREEVVPKLNLDKVIDVGVRTILQKRLYEFGGDAKKAFINLNEKPIWLNKEKSIPIKRVTITGKKNVVAIHHKKNHNGNYILNEYGEKQPVDFVSTGNNHHVAIYRDEDGKLQEEVVSFYKAVLRANEGEPIISKYHQEHPDWEFLFTMKQNEYFVFPSDDFKPSEIDLKNPKNANIISPHLFRVQKISTKNYFFRHHLETTVENLKELDTIAYKSQLGLNGIEGIIKVRINHLGQIVKVGEY